MIATNSLLRRLAVVAIALLPVAGCATTTAGIDASISTASIPVSATTSPAQAGSDKRKSAAIAAMSACDPSTNIFCWLRAAVSPKTDPFPVSSIPSRPTGRFTAQPAAHDRGEGQDSIAPAGPQTSLEPAAPGPETAPEAAPALSAEAIGSGPVGEDSPGGDGQSAPGESSVADAEPDSPAPEAAPALSAEPIS